MYTATIDKSNVQTHTPSYPCLHVKYICVIGTAPKESSKHHCSVVVYLGEGVTSQWRWLLSSRRLHCPHSCRVSNTTEKCEPE